MGHPVPGNGVGRATTSTTSQTPLANAKGHSESSNPTGGAGGSRPVVSERLKTKTNFFDLFLSKKQIGRNQKHAEVMAAIKAYSKIEKQLIDVNSRLDALINVLTIATEGGTKSLLLAAADEAQTSLNTYGTLLENLTRSHAQQVLLQPEIDLFQRDWRAVNKKFGALNALNQKTYNYSVDVHTKIQDVISEKDRLLPTHNAFLVAHPEAKLPPKPVRDDQTTKIDSATGNH